MDTAEVDETILSLQVDRIRTNASDSGTEVGQDGGTSVAHLTLDRELSLDVNLSNHSPDCKGSNTRQKENRREDDDSDEFCDHADTHSDDGIKIVWNRTIDCKCC